MEIIDVLDKCEMEGLKREDGRIEKCIGKLGNDKLVWT